MNFVPRQTLLVELLKERIWVEFLYVEDTGLAPKTFEEHHGTYHGWHSSGVAYALHARLFIGGAMRAIIIYIIGVLLAILQSANATAYGGLSLVVLT